MAEQPPPNEKKKSKDELKLEALLDSQLRTIDILNEKIERLEHEKIQVVMIPEKCTKQINWADLHAYIVKLSQPTHFSDCPEIEFDRMVILTRREFEREFHFSDLQLYLVEDEIDVVGQAGSAWMVRISADLPDSIPIMLVAYTERDIEEFMDIVIDANAIKTLKERVLERMHLNMLNSYRKFQGKLDEAVFMSEKDRADKEELLRKFQTRLALYDNDTQDKVNDYKEEKMKKWQQALLGAGWIVAFVMAFFL